MRTIRGGSPQALREANKRLLLERLLEAPDGLTRPQLARSLALTVTAIANLVAGDGENLADVLDESPARAQSLRANSGPVPKVVRLKPRLGYVVGIVLGKTLVQVAIADLFGRFDAERDAHMAEWDVENDLHGALAHVATTIHELANAHDVVPEMIAGIGLSIAAPVDVSTGPNPTDRRGHIRFNLGSGVHSPWTNIDPVAAVTNHLAALPDGRRWSAIELHVDNDANLGALAEHKLGAGRGKQNIIYIRLTGAGIGGGLVFEGTTYRGAGGIAGELGHVVLEPDRTERCPRCGRPCLETIILTTLGCRRTDSCEGAVLDEVTRGDEAMQAALDGDHAAIAAIREAADYLGRAIALFVTLLNPDRVVIGGLLPAQAYSLVIPPIQDAVARLAIAPAARDFVVELGALHDDASLEGAIWLALDRTRLNHLLGCAARSRSSSPATHETATSFPPTDA